MSQTRTMISAWRDVYALDIADDVLLQLELSIDELLRSQARSGLPISPDTQAVIELLARSQLILWLQASDPQRRWYYQDGHWHALPISEWQGKPPARERNLQPVQELAEK